MRRSDNARLVGIRCSIGLYLDIYHGDRFLTYDNELNLNFFRAEAVDSFAHVDAGILRGHLLDLEALLARREPVPRVPVDGLGVLLPDEEGPGAGVG